MHSAHTTHTHSCHLCLPYTPVLGVWGWESFPSDRLCWPLWEGMPNVKGPKEFLERSTVAYLTFAAHPHWLSRELLAEALRHSFLELLRCSETCQWFPSHKQNDQSRTVFCREKKKSHILPRTDSDGASDSLWIMTVRAHHKSQLSPWGCGVKDMSRSTQRCQSVGAVRWIAFLYLDVLTTRKWPRPSCLCSPFRNIQGNRVKQKTNPSQHAQPRPPSPPGPWVHCPEPTVEGENSLVKVVFWPLCTCTLVHTHSQSCTYIQGHNKNKC